MTEETVTNESLLKPAPEAIERRPVSTAARVLMGGPVALVTSSWRGRHNVMPLAWHMPVSSDPALIAIAIEQSRYSVDVIDHSEELKLGGERRLVTVLFADVVLFTPLAEAHPPRGHQPWPG